MICSSRGSLLLLVFLFVFGLCFSVTARTWTSTSGSQIEADLTGFEDGAAILKKADGSELKVKVHQLSESDQAFLKEELKKNPVYRIREVALFPIKVDGKFGYIDVLGKVVIPPTYQKAEMFGGGLGLVEGPYPGFVNADGTPVIGVDKVGPGDAYRSFADGVAPFRKGSKWGLIDVTGKVILEPRYADIRSFSEKRAAVRVGAQDQWGIGKRGYIDPTGKMVIEPVYNEALDFSDGLGAVNLKGVYGSWGFVDSTGKVVIEPQFHRAYSFYGGIARAMPKEGGGFGLIYKTGKYVLSKEEKTEKQGGLSIKRTTWYHTENFGCGVAPVKFKDDLFLVDHKGKRASKKLPYRYVSQFVEERAIYQVDGLYGYLDTKGQVVIKATYENAKSFQNGLAFVETKTESAYIDQGGKIVWRGPK